MSDLTFLEQEQLEDLFQMKGGFVLNFYDRTFRSFIADAVRRDILDEKYKFASNSKANRLRQFWKVESNLVAGTLIKAMIDYAESRCDVDKSHIPVGRTIAARLLRSAPVQELDAIQSVTDDRTVEALVESVREAIEKDQPEKGLDRLHTFVVNYVRTVCEGHGLPISKDKPLHSMFGEYVKHLRSEGLLESEMTDRILKSSISTLESFNHVRNNQSLAHDNPILNYEESLLIFNNVCASLRFIQSLARKP